jgi:hypothetical protein
LAALATVIVAIVAVPIVATGGPVSFLEEAVNILYPIGDLAVAIGALLIALLLIGGAFSVPWGLIATGCFCVAASDLLYASAVWHGTYQVDPAGGINILTFVVNVLYVASYLITDTGLYMQARLQKVI